jgi:hypothetical protein
MKPGEQIEIERLGGLAGMGLPGSRIRSRLRLGAADMSADEHRAVHQALTAPAAEPPLARDGFRYRLTLHGDTGPQHSVEVPESQLPESLRNRVVDELI